MENFKQQSRPFPSIIFFSIATVSCSFFSSCGSRLAAMRRDGILGLKPGWRTSAMGSGTTRFYISRLENNHTDVELSTFRKIVEAGLGKQFKLIIE